MKLEVGRDSLCWEVEMVGLCLEVERGPLY